MHKHSYVYTPNNYNPQFICSAVVGFHYLFESHQPSLCIFYDLYFIAVMVSFSPFFGVSVVFTSKDQTSVAAKV